VVEFNSCVDQWSDHQEVTVWCFSAALSVIGDSSPPQTI